MLSIARRRYLTLGIAREGKNRWERRVALSPTAIHQLISEHKVKVIVQPSTKRIFPDDAYKTAGALISHDLSKADVILAVKEVPISELLANKTYMYFSHTHKGQSHNMPMLDEILKKKIRLMDYELLTDENYRRLVAFGRFAGYAGMLDGLVGMGQRLLSQGYGTPLLNIGMSYKYASLQDARLDLFKIGLDIKDNGLPRELGPLIFTFVGDGNGAMYMFNCLPVEVVKPANLKALVENKDFDANKVYLCQTFLEDYIIRKSNGEKIQKKDRDEYYSNPEHFKSVFHSEIAPYASMLVNGILWDPRYPRLLTKEQMKYVDKYGRMFTVADISCDIGGSLEFMSKASSIDEPFFVYDAKTDTVDDSPTAPGVQVMSVDNLPTELPLESSNFFSTALFPHIVKMAKNQYEDPVLSRAVITTLDGKLADAHRGLQSHIDKHVSSGFQTSALAKRVLVLGSGYVAAPLVDYLLRSKQTFITVASNDAAEAREIATSQSHSAIASLDVSDITSLSKLIKESDAVVSLVPATLHTSVAKECIKHGKNMLTASYISPEMAKLHDKARAKGITILNELGLDPGIDHLTAMRFFHQTQARGGKVDRFVSWCGGLPAPECSDNPLGYKFSWSPRGVLLAGLNDAIYKRDGKVRNVKGPGLFRDVIGVDIFKGMALEGIPNRDSLKYTDVYGIGPLDSMKDMFRGTLRYKGFCELADALKILGFFDTAARSDMTSGSIPWSTLLYSILRVEKQDQVLPAICKVLTSSRQTLGLVTDKVEVDRIGQRVYSMMTWLNMFSNETLVKVGPGSPASVLDAFCGILQDNLQYGSGERDMVCMHHEFGILMPDGEMETHTSTLVAYGETNGYSAMAKTVGLPAAMGVELLLSGKIGGRGVIAPISKDVYDPILELLEKEGIVFSEKRIT